LFFKFKNPSKTNFALKNNLLVKFCYQQHSSLCLLACLLAGWLAGYYQLVA
jgi:hypothetical protein